jgi:hypothetical protein
MTPVSISHHPQAARLAASCANPRMFGDTPGNFLVPSTAMMRYYHRGGFRAMQGTEESRNRGTVQTSTLLVVETKKSKKQTAVKRVDV